MGRVPGVVDGYGSEPQEMRGEPRRCRTASPPSTSGTRRGLTEVVPSLLLGVTKHWPWGPREIARPQHRSCVVHLTLPSPERLCRGFNSREVV